MLCGLKVCALGMHLIRQIEKCLAEDMIVKNHYSHKWSLCQIAYGIFYISDHESDFFDAKEERKQYEPRSIGWPTSAC